MKNKKKLLIISGIIIIIIVCIITCIMTRNKKQTIDNSDKFTYIGNSNIIKIEYDDNYVITNYEDYKNLNLNGLTEEDFKKHNYALIKVQDDSCSESEMTPSNYKIKDNNIEVTFTFKASCGVCAPYTRYYFLEIDKGLTKVKISVNYKATNKPKCDNNMTYKPIIYLYPEEDTNVTIKLGNPELLTTTYPKYKNEWNVLAKTNGYLIDESGRTYYGLYWEANNTIKTNFKDGFIISKDEIIPFIEEKLQILGLNEREVNEFIIYWLPILEQNKYNIIRFENIDIINDQMPLDINPKPNTVIRVLMEFKPINKRINIKEQELITPIREGFTVVEWGGTLIND